jgi:hypothetical protein
MSGFQPSSHTLAITQPYPTPASQERSRGPRFGLGWDMAAPSALNKTSQVQGLSQVLYVDTA